MQNQPQQVHYTNFAASSSGHGFVSFFETDPVRVDVLNATYEEQRTRRTRRNPTVLRRLSSSCTIMDGIPNSQSSTLSKKVMSHC